MATSLPCGTLLVFFFLLIFCLHEPLLHAIDAITMNKPLSGDQKLVSQRGKFALGFFQPAGGSDGNWYIGIWYNRISVQTVVWVANRDKPIFDPASSQLTISTDGNMVLLSQFKSLIWSTNVNSIASNSTVVVLLDTGNLVLSRASNTSNVLWQSFDHFGNTWLPGSKLSRNKVTGVSRQMTAWKDRGDPALGMFSKELDPDGSKQYVLVWNNSQQYWTTGNWTGHSFSNLPELAPTRTSYSSQFTSQFVDNNWESYYILYTNKDDAPLLRLFMDVSGQVQGFLWSEAQQNWILYFAEPRAKCDVYSACGAFSKCTEDASSPCSCLKGFTQQNARSWELGGQTTGCKRNVPLQCGGNKPAKAEKDKFYVTNYVKLPDKAQNIEATSIRECELVCLNNCSCTAYSYNGSCSLWYADLINLHDSVGVSTGNLYIRLAASELSSSKEIKKWQIFGIVIGGVAIFAFVVTILSFLSRKRRIKGLNCTKGTVTNFRYSDLQFMTKNFSDKLGGGSFGFVFKGLLPDATIIAVKKLEGLRQGEKQFRAEVSTIGTIQHINVIRLLGFCSERARRLLVYEYMPNGSLDRHLFGSNSRILSWNTRYQIALGIAKGLAYLHDNCRDCIIHCDIKPENILLDASFIPKVADFGLAKLVCRDFSRVLTTIRGTIGYLAPEWISGTTITTKVDVFSYGMMLFEIISRKRNIIGQGEQSAETFFPALVGMKLPKGDVQALLDSELIVDANLQELERACKVACWCVQYDEKSRPTMGEVVQILEGSVDANMPPPARYLQILAEDPNYVKFFSDELSN